MTELKACPFCGNIAGRRFEPTEGDYYGCPNHTNMMMTIEQWNIRPIEDELQRKLDIAVDALVLLADGWQDRVMNIAINALAEIEKPVPESSQ